MSQQQIALVRRKYEAWNRGDISAVIDLTEPDFQWVEPREIVGISGGRGRGGFARYLRGLFEVWEEYRWQPEEFRLVGDVLLVRVLEIGRGKLSGAYVQQRFVHLWTIRNGRSMRLERYIDEREALQRLTHLARPVAVPSPSPA
jgi:ketosteroid isomerase-like protein